MGSRRGEGSVGERREVGVAEIFISLLCPIGIEVFTSLQTIVASMGPVKGCGRLQAPPSWEFLFAAEILNMAHSRGRGKALCRW